MVALTARSRCGVTGICHRHECLAEKRYAFDVSAGYLGEIIRPGIA